MSRVKLNAEFPFLDYQKCGEGEITVYRVHLIQIRRISDSENTDFGALAGGAHSAKCNLRIRAPCGFSGAVVLAKRFCRTRDRELKAHCTCETGVIDQSSESSALIAYTHDQIIKREEGSLFRIPFS